ncbi:MAG: 4'-phosphopantetheinyl transferase [Arenicella sp.]
MKTPTVTVYYHFLNTEIPKNQFRKLLNQLPLVWQKRIPKYVRYQDRHLGLVGKLMLKKAFQDFGLEEKAVNQIRENEFGKPELNRAYNSTIKFNISHSHKLVVLAISQDCQFLGIDTEFIKALDWEMLKGNFSDSELSQIRNSQNPTEKFYEFWAKKESYMKADGRGLSLEPIKIFLNGNSITDSENKLKLFIQNHDLSEYYQTYICCEHSFLSVRVAHFEV